MSTMAEAVTNADDEHEQYRNMDPLLMQEYLQNLYGLPVVLKNKKWDAVLCPYCEHAHAVHSTGYTEAMCVERPKAISVGGRVFHPNYGLHVFEFELENGVYYVDRHPNLPALEM